MRKQDASVGMRPPVSEPDYAPDPEEAGATQYGEKVRGFLGRVCDEPRSVIDDNIGFQRAKNGKTG
ncbi:hypothetical protein ABT186_30620 [Streptomyces sp. NPDC001634]|uniref:hypothetical protein n=1 Tax=Streptomyces sp. NPDC001634 TaxID=3154390 RepID=UPI003325EB94